MLWELPSLLTSRMYPSSIVNVGVEMYLSREKRIFSVVYRFLFNKRELQCKSDSVWNAIHVRYEKAIFSSVGWICVWMSLPFSYNLSSFTSILGIYYECYVISFSACEEAILFRFDDLKVKCKQIVGRKKYDSKKRCLSKVPT